MWDVFVWGAQFPDVNCVRMNKLTVKNFQVLRADFVEIAEQKVVNESLSMGMKNELRGECVRTARKFFLK